MKKKRFVMMAFFAAVLLAAAPGMAEESPIGIWKTIDDDGKTAKSHVQIFEKEGLIYGRVIKLLRKSQDTLCDKCKGDKKDKPIVGMEIIWGLKKEKDKNTYSGGSILDPDNGKTYRCKIWREGDLLKVRGYLAFFFRTQTWHLVKE